MMSRVKNSNEISNCLQKRLKKTIIKFRLQYGAILGLLFALSSFQGRVININESNIENYQDIFYSQMNQFLDNEIEGNFPRDEIKSKLNILKELYNKTGYQPYWTINYKLNERAGEFIDIISTSYYYGLDSNEYHINYLRNLKAGLITEKNIVKQAQLRLQAEIMFSLSSLRFLNALHNGVLHERGTDYDSDGIGNETLIQYLAEGLNAENFKSYLLSYQPDILPYTRLQRGLEYFLKSIEINHSIEELPDPQKQPEQAKSIAKHILISLSYAHNIENDEIYEITIKKFQKLHGLNQSGKLDKKTCKALSMSSRERFEKIALNLERLRQDKWTDNSFILVNIPSFQLKVLENNTEVAIYKTIIGKPVSPTPVFSDKIEKIVTNPSWIVPQSISSKELLYKAKTDSTYLERNKYVVFNEAREKISPNEVNWNEISSANFKYTLIQQSSANNALGKLKFLFPNAYSVYVHDTPSKRLFSNDYRAYSHGCVRLENPHQLAAYLIKKQNIPGWENKLEKNLDKGIQEIFELANPVDIHIRYYTCEADDKGQIYFYNDIYNLDAELLSKIYSEKTESQQLLAKK